MGTVRMSTLRSIAENQPDMIEQHIPNREVFDELVLLQ